jgi:hypothetical protein
VRPRAAPRQRKVARGRTFHPEVQPGPVTAHRRARPAIRYATTRRSRQAGQRTVSHSSRVRPDRPRPTTPTGRNRSARHLRHDPQRRHSRRHGQRSRVRNHSNSVRSQHNNAPSLHSVRSRSSNVHNRNSVLRRAHSLRNVRNHNSSGHSNSGLSSRARKQRNALSLLVLRPNRRRRTTRTTDTDKAVRRSESCP